MNNHLVTIAVPSYNHGEYIHYCLDGIRDEGYSNKEILIIDDGSSDDSIEKIMQWKSKNPKISLTLIARKNKGLNATLNELVANANGEFICFIASDDILLKDAVSSRLKVFEKRPEKYAVIGDAKVINSTNDIIMDSAIEDLYRGNKENYKDDSRLLSSVVKEWSVPGPVLMVRKDLYKIIGPYPEKQFAEDINFYMKVVGLRLLAFIDHPVALYRIHSYNTGGNSKFSKQLSMAFIRAYIGNIKYYPFKLQLIILKRLAGRFYLYLKAYL